VTDYDRRVMLTQVPEYDVTYVRDENNVVVDTTYTPVANPAVAGVHYVAFDDAAQQARWVVPAGSNRALLPITLLRDVSLDAGPVRLRVAVVANGDFEPGMVETRQRTLQFADGLLKPAWWDDQNVTVTLGPWSAVKHAFMIETSGERIDQEWFDTKYNALGNPALTGMPSIWDGFFNSELAEFNADPANIASGRAPLMDENGNRVAF
jgi:hypothetical protein